MKTLSIIIVASLFVGCGSGTGTNALIDPCLNCKVNEVCTVDGKCVANCTPQCGNQVCGSDPICNTSCGECGSDSACVVGQCQLKDPCKGACKATELCTVDGKCIFGCVPECTNRMCGGDPLCNVSCGDCATGANCNSNGQCEDYDYNKLMGKQCVSHYDCSFNTVNCISDGTTITVTYKNTKETYSAVVLELKITEDFKKYTSFIIDGNTMHNNDNVTATFWRSTYSEPFSSQSHCTIEIYNGSILKLNCQFFFRDLDGNYTFDMLSQTDCIINN